MMSRLARKIEDKRVLRLIRRYLQAGSWKEGWLHRGRKGHRKAAHSRRCCRTSFWTSWTRNWSDAGMPSAVTPMTATFTS